MNKEVYKHLLNTYGRQPGLWFALFTETIRSLVLRVFAVILIANMGAALTGGDIQLARRYVWLYLFTVSIGTILGVAGDIIAIRSENNVYSSLMAAYYKKLTHKDMAFYRNHHTGYLTAMFRQYLDSGMFLVRQFRTSVIRMFISFTVPSVVLLTVSWKIGLIAFLIVISQAIYMFWASAKINKYRALAHEIYRKISGEVADDITNIVAYKSSGMEKSAARRLDKLRHQETETFWIRRKASILLDFPRNIVTVFLMFLAFWFVLDASSAGDSVKLLILTLTYMFQIYRNVGDLPELIAEHDEYVTKLEPTLATLNSAEEKIKDIENPRKLKITKAAVNIKNLSFKYKDHSAAKYVFKDLNISIAGGEHVGIVGLSGAGKSTLASLLMRFDDIDSGEILIDGTDIRQVSQSELRQKIAYVPQEPILFHRSIRDNIAYHNSAATEQDIINAAKAAYAHEFISELPNGYDTIVGERGVKLSGGQKQRIVIARAALKDASIVLFDEATSALDSESEHIIQQSLPKIIGKHTAIIIAHRLSTVASLDRIIVMHNGKIEEEGTHEELLAKKGRYYSLWQKQIRQQK